MRRSNYIRELHGASEFLSGSTSYDREMDDARRAGAELRRTQTSTDQRLDELASQIEVQKLRHDELATQMQWQTSRHIDLVTQMQSMTAMIGRFVKPVIPAPIHKKQPSNPGSYSTKIRLEMMETGSPTRALFMAQRH